MNVNDLPELTLLHRPNGDLASVYAQVHAMDGPGIFRSPDGNGLIATSYEAIQALRKSPHLESLKRDLRIGGSGDVGALAAVSQYTPFFVNEPLHTPLSTVTYKPFNPIRREEIIDRFTICVRDALRSLPSGETCDLVEEYARKITLAYWVQEIGAPMGMMPVFSEWSKAIEPMLAFQCSEAQVASANYAAQEMWDYLRDLAETSGEASLLSRYTDYLAEMPKDHRCGADLVAAITFDGIDSAAGAIANFLYVILSNDERQATLRKRPELMDSAFREAMRLESPLPGLHRGTTAPVGYADIAIPEGINIFMAWGCASRDPNAYDEPDAFIFNRTNRTLLSFGGGKRFCKGRTLAMVQSALALQLLLENTEWIELTQTSNWSPPGSLRTVDALNCKIHH